MLAMPRIFSRYKCHALDPEVLSRCSFTETRCFVNSKKIVRTVLTFVIEDYRNNITYVKLVRGAQIIKKYRASNIRPANQ